MNHPTTSTRRVAALALLTAAGCGSSVDAAGEPTTSDSVSATPEPEPPGPGVRHRRHPIPEEAIAACEGADEGSECAVELPERTLEGTCHEGPDGQAIACAPPLPPPGRPPGAEVHPPGPAPGGEVRPPRGGEVRLRRGGEVRLPGPPAAALAACAEQAAGDACTARLPALRVSGICRRPPDPAAPLACAPPLPPAPPAAGPAAP